MLSALAPCALARRDICDVARTCPVTSTMSPSSTSVHSVPVSNSEITNCVSVRRGLHQASFTQSTEQGKHMMNPDGNQTVTLGYYLNQSRQLACLWSCMAPVGN